MSEGISSPQTKKKYEYHFRRFLEHFDIPSKEALLDIKDPRVIEAYIIQYIKYLSSERKLVYATIHHIVAAIIHFFDMNDVLLNKRKVNKFIPPNEVSHEDRPYSVQEIQRILEHCDERSRVIFLLMASTGMRIGAIADLKFEDLIEIPTSRLYKISIYASSKKDRYYTFCTPECADAIKKYKMHRERFGEVITKDSPLIRESFDTMSHFHCEHPQRMKTHGIEIIVSRTLAKSGLATTGEVMRSHGFRKRYVTIMKNCKVDYSDREYLVGHKKSRGLDVNYDRSSVNERLVEFTKAINSLTINEEHKLKMKISDIEQKHSQEYGALKKEMEELRRILESV